MNDYKLYKNYKMSNVSYNKMGGEVSNFFDVKSIKGLKKVFKIIRKFNYDFYVIGGSSKILFPDIIIREAIIRINILGLKKKKQNIVINSGEKLAKIANILSENGYIGFEELCGIPGTIGGAIVNNAGAFSQEINDNLKYIIVYDYQHQKIKKIKKKNITFSYRNSSLKESDYIILKACLNLKKGIREEILRKRYECQNYRIKTQPVNKLTLGSTFKNDQNLKISKILDQLNAKGIKDGKVNVSNKHVNFIENTQGSLQKNYLNILVILRSLVYNKHKYLPQLEVIILRW